MTGTMARFRCWSSSSVRQTVYSDIGALPSEANAIFLAAHTPMVLFHEKGEEIPGAGSGERQVLAALLAGIGDKDRNTLIAVTGRSGAGKSHVVRWVHAHLDNKDERYHVLYVPRAVQTIRELLRRLVVGLPGGGGQELIGRIDNAVGSVRPGELQDRLLEEMRLALTWTLEPRPRRDGESPNEEASREERNILLGEPDEQGKRRNGLADLLSLAEVNRALLRPEGRLHQLVQSIYAKTSRRDEQQEGFGREDLPLREAGVRRAVAGNPALRELWDIIRQDPGPALDLLDEALRIAVPRTLGLRGQSGESLDLLFRRSREALRKQGKELILLFEDLAQFGLIDGELYDQFATQPGSDLAPLRVVFAVTDGPYDKLPETVKTRITHKFSVESSALADQEAFVARYLNLVRLGRSGVEADWMRAKGSDTDAWVRNACDTREDGLPCRFRDQCHAAFGTVEVSGLGHVGLYPYNHSALRRALAGQGPNPTPRSILDVCVSEALIEADAHIGRGTYPHERVQERFDFKVQCPRDAVLAGKTGEQAERLYRALVLWGDEQGLPTTIADAFSLELQATQHTVTLASGAQSVRSKEIVKETESSPLPPLFDWRNGDHLPDGHADFYRSVLYRLVLARLNLDQDLFHTANGEGLRILQELFSQMSFDLEGARGRTPGIGRVRFEIHRNDDDVRVLVGARWFFEHGHWRPEDGNWPWPPGYDPADLMLSLEQRLDEWSSTVRAAFQKRVRGRELARAAVGTRAVALLALGVSPEELQSVNDVLEMVAPAKVQTTARWAGADRAARDLLRRVDAVQLVGQFAAVRQGSTGAPQLVDAIELEAGLREVLESPIDHLRHVVAQLHDVSPVLVEAAQNLLTAIEQSAPTLLHEVTAALNDIKVALEGQQPSAVARAAREVGRRAKDSGLFRPADGWSDFAVALETLETLPSVPLDWHRSAERQDDEEALAVQHWAQAAIVGAQALQVVRRSMAATMRECTRSEGAIGDLGQLRQQVRKKLSQVEGYLHALSSTEAQHG